MHIGINIGINSKVPGSGGAVPPDGDYYIQEDNTDKYLTEDGTGYYIQED